MNEWHRLIQIVVDEIDKRIQNRDDEALTLRALSRTLGYSEFHTTRRFRALSGWSFRDYLRLRKLAFALIDVRDTRKPFLEIAVDYGFSSHEAFTRAFKSAYGITPKDYRKRPVPVTLRTKINTFDRYILGIGEIGMAESTKDIKIYYITMPAHKFMYICDYESDGYFDFWARRENTPGQDCDTVCGLLDNVKGKLDGNDDEIGKFSGQIMGYIFEDGKRAECYGVRLPVTYNGPVPEIMQVADVPEAEYIVFEHGPFHYETDSEAVGEKLAQAMAEFSFDDSEYALDEQAERVAYFYFDSERFEKRIRPVKAAK